MIYEQLAVLNTSASRLAAATAYLEQGFADGKLRPDRYYVQDRIYRKDQNTDLLQNTASTIGQALAALEVLAIIAYNQPVTKSFIEQIRGVDSSSVVNALVAKELVQEMGRLEIPGRPISYGTTEHFLRCFGMKSIETLPKLPQSTQNAQESEQA